MNNEIKKFDYVEFAILDKRKNQSKELQTHSGFIGITNFSNEAFLALTKGKLDNNREIFYKGENAKIHLKLIKHNKTPVRYHEIMQKNLDLQNKLFEAQTNMFELISKLESQEKTSLQKENEFKSQVFELQKKAQEQINEHKQKNDEHIQTQISEIKKFALQSFLEDILLPLNNFDLAIQAAQKIDNQIVQNFTKGFEMLYSQVESILQSFGVTKIIPKIGDKFDANIHQIYEMIASDYEKETILEVKNIGYKLHERTIKPALVVISK
ncbi:nucleotide exchange factor GrpE [Metamycoplasma equirhinis]|uniref:nucleotide exchange factor GrpE n=1 Tax=Metamycoplasma equirhinis TaxID=92402 RepID=UPI0035947B60